MVSPQQGIFVEGTSVHRFQQYDIAEPIDVVAAAAALSSLAALQAKIAVDGDSRVAVVVGLSVNLAMALEIDIPSGFRSFETIAGSGHSATATQHDLFVWIHGDAQGDVFDMALQARRSLTEAGSIIADVPAFVYRDSRDLTGFIDGTENPEVEEARNLAVVADGLAGAGGSVAIVQQWVHDLDAFHALPETDQENVIGRTKDDSTELAEDVLPADAHIARVVMEDDAGEEIEIYRRSVPWGTSVEAGLVFVAFTDELVKIDNMLRAMFGVALHGETASVGPQDRLIDFSSVTSSGYFFCPSQDSLDGLSPLGNGAGPS